MIGTDYWWLLIWIFAGGVILSVVFPRKTETLTDTAAEQWQWLPAFLLMLPYVFWCAFRTDGFGDTGAYRRGFLNCVTAFSQIPDYMATVTKDKGFYWLQAVLRCVLGNHDKLYFFLIALFQLGVLVWLYRRYSCDYWMSIFLFVASTDYLSWTFNGIRQFVAVTIILLATPFMLKKKYIPAVALILLASTMHQSALIMLLFMLIAQGRAWNVRTLLFLAATIAAVLFVDRFTDILDNAMQDTQYANMVTDWESWKDDGVNPIRVLVYAVPTILSLVGLRIIRAEDDLIINFCTNMSIISTGFYLIAMVTSGIFMGRIPVYASMYNYILLPWEIKHMFAKESSKLMTVLMIVAYCVFFYYQMHFTWGLL